MRLPWSFTPGAPLTVDILTLTGQRVARLHQGPAAPGLTTTCLWDRRTEKGERAAPGFYYLLAEGDRHRVLRTIVVAP